MPKTPKDEKSMWIRFALKKVMPKIAEITKQQVEGYHGLNHTEQVVLFGIDYALAAGANPLPVILACALHDCARTTEGYDTHHAPNCEPIARAFLAENTFNITEQEKEQIIFAIVHHTTGRQAPDLISACLWDADRTRLSWQYGYAERFFTTDRAKQVASLSIGQQYIYMENQTKLLDSLKVPSLLNTKSQKKADARLVQQIRDEIAKKRAHDI